MSSQFGTPFQVTNMIAEMMFVLDHRFREHVQNEPCLRPECDQGEFKLFERQFSERASDWVRNLIRALARAVFDYLVRNFVNSRVMEGMFKPRRLLPMGELCKVRCDLIDHPKLDIWKDSFEKVWGS
jgi:hypothetical protein